MAQISIGDLTGSEQIDVSDNSQAAEHHLTALKTATHLIAALSKPVTDPTFQYAAFSTAFDKSSIPLKGHTVAVSASVNSTLSVCRQQDSPLLGADDPIEIPPNECWVAFELDTRLDASVTVPLPQGFGVSFDASTAPSFTTYKHISAPDTTLLKAIGQTLDNFAILESSDDVLAIPQGVIHTTDLSGTVTLGGYWALPLSVNQLSLADATLPFNAQVSISPAVSVDVDGDICLTSEFSVRFRRSAANALRIGLYKKRGATFEASLTASAGIEAATSQTGLIQTDLIPTDLIKKFFTAVAPDVDFSGMQPGDSDTFGQVLKDSLDRSLAISLNAACSAAFTDEAA